MFHKKFKTCTRYLSGFIEEQKQDLKLNLQKISYLKHMFFGFQRVGVSFQNFIKKRDFLKMSLENPDLESKFPLYHLPV